MNVGVIGLGAMGTPMAENLRASGMLAAVYNRTRSKTDAFAGRGLSVAESAARLAEQVDVILIMVSADEDLFEVLRGRDGVLSGLQRGASVINSSTVSIEATEEVGKAVRSAGGRFVDAPVSGTVGPAEEGTLTVLAGADDGTLAEVRPVLEAIGDPIVHCGGIGAGTRTKLFVNLLLGNLLQSYAEALVFGQKHGLSLDHMQQVIESGPVGAPLFQYKRPVIEDRDFEKQFPVDLLLKDLDLISEAAEKQGIYLPQTAATREAANGAKALGHGDEDMMAVIKLLESVAGTTVGEDGE